MKVDATCNFYVFLFGLMWWTMQVSTSVTINSIGRFGNTGIVQCGSEITLMCNISTYKYTMTWEIDSEIVAECTLSECTNTELENIIFTNNTSTGIFTMTINPATFATNGKVITCEDGKYSADVTIDVKVLPEQISTSIYDSSYHDKLNITVETGCVFPNASVMFLWYYYEAGNTPNLYKDSSPVENTDISGCATGSCGGVGFATRSSSLSIPDIQDDKEYYFQVHISQNDAPENYHDVIINSTRTYKIKVTTDLNSSIGLTVGLVTGGVMVLVVVVSTVVILKCRMERNRA